MADINDLMTVSIGVSLNGIEKQDDGSEAPLNSSIELNLRVCDDAAEGTICLLRDIADAIEQGRLYGWMEQEQLSARVECGYLRPETFEEEFARFRAAYQGDDG